MLEGDFFVTFHIFKEEGVSNVLLLWYQMKDKEEANLILEFQNLTHLELGYSDYTRDWIERLEVIKRFPNLQILDIDMVWWVEHLKVISIFTFFFT